MRILLQHQGSGKYLQAPGVWVANPAEAHDFPSSNHAIWFCLEQKLSNVKLVFQFENQRAFIERPLRGEELQLA